MGRTCNQEPLVQHSVASLLHPPAPFLEPSISRALILLPESGRRRFWPRLFQCSECPDTPPLPLCDQKFCFPPQLLALHGWCNFQACNLCNRWIPRSKTCIFSPKPEPAYFEPGTFLHTRPKRELEVLQWKPVHRLHSRRLVCSSLHIGQIPAGSSCFLHRGTHCHIQAQRLLQAACLNFPKARSAVFCTGIWGGWMMLAGAQCGGNWAIGESLSFPDPRWFGSTSSRCKAWVMLKGIQMHTKAINSKGRAWVTKIVGNFQKTFDTGMFFGWLKRLSDQ